MQKSKVLMGIVACAALMQAGVALAENRAETFILSPYAGGYTYQGKQDIKTGPVFGVRLGYNITDNWALEGVLDYANSDVKGISAKAEKVRFGGDLVYSFLPQNSLVPYVAAGFGGMDLKVAGENSGTRWVANYGGGVKWFLADDVALRADVRGLNYSIGEVFTNVQYTLGLHIAIGAPKPAPKPVEAVAPKAAPVVVPPAPTASLAANPGSIEKGKSVTLSWNSQNATGCEIQPGVGPVATQGSKEVMPASDVSYTLTCKGEGGSAKSAAAVAVTVPPPPVMAEAAAKKASPVAAGARLTLKVLFDTNKSVIKKQYHEELKIVGDGLNEQKHLKGVIEGYTDSVGGDAFNMALSKRRANAVRDYIIKNFKVDGKRLTAKGFGKTHPVADNKTAEGRAQNRRIEATFEEIPNFKPDAEKPAAPVKKTAKKVVKKKAAADKP